MILGEGMSENPAVNCPGRDSEQVESLKWFRKAEITPNNTTQDLTSSPLGYSVSLNSQLLNHKPPLAFKWLTGRLLQCSPNTIRIVFGVSQLNQSD